VGGGEKYFFDVARILAKKHDVSVMVSLPPTEINQEKIQQQYETFLGESLTGVTFISGPLGTSASWWTKIWWTQQFDVLYFLTDGSLFFSLAKRNIVHIQIPFTQPKKSLIDRFKLANWEVKNTNSYFTKSIVEKAWQTRITAVHWPMIEVPTSSPKVVLADKEKIILHVGRFFTHQHTKRQDVLVEFFKKLRDTYPRITQGWKLVLIGSVEETEADQAYAAQVKQAAAGYPIEILHSVSRRSLWQYYQRASIYWHATGYEADEERNPEKVEHFGISTVEAMAMGCAPVVINKGGQPEVLGDELAEWLWSGEKECLEKTVELISNHKKLITVQKSAQQRAVVFSETTFKKTLQLMIGETV
jgi:glycosyltransferase involved in cell wall biosynthesis